jgi:hypothetical protein
MIFTLALRNATPAVYITDWSERPSFDRLAYAVRPVDNRATESMERMWVLLDTR